MSKKFGKFLLFTTVAGAAAYGAYHYLQTKDKTPSAPSDEDTDDDFDDFSEDLDEDTDTEKERSYVSLQLDKAEAIASEAFQKAKGVIADSVQQVKDTVKSVKEGQTASESNFTDLTALNKEKNTAAESTDSSSIPSDEGSHTDKADMDKADTDKTDTDKSDTSSGNAAGAGENTGEVPSQPSVSQQNVSPVSETVEEFFDDDL